MPTWNPQTKRWDEEDNTVQGLGSMAFTSQPAIPAESYEPFLQASTLPPPAPNQIERQNIPLSSETTTTTTQKTQTPEEKNLLKQADAYQTESINLQTKTNEINQQIAEAQHVKAKEENERQLAKQEQVDKVVNDGYQELQAKLTDAYGQYNNYKNMKIEDYWSKKGTGAMIGSLVAQALGGFGAALTGGKNQAADIINSAIDRDFQIQRANIDKQRDTITMAKQGIEMTREGRDDQLKMLDIKEAAAKDAIAAKYEERLKNQGISQEAINSDANLLKLKQNANNAHLKIQEDLRKSVTDQTQKKIQSIEIDKRTGLPAVRGGSEAENKLADRFEKLPEIRKYKDMAGSYAKIQATTPDTAQGHMALVYTFMKMLDPGSTVMQGEHASAEQTRGIPDTVVQLYNKAIAGEKLSPTQVAQFKREAKIQLAAAKADIRKPVQEFNRMAKEQGMKPENVIILSDPLAKKAEEKKAQQSTSPSSAGRIYITNPEDL